MAVDPVAATPASPVTTAIRQAAQTTGVSFQYLLTTAKIESSLNPSAQASTSSAKGLYQFIDQTWLGTMKSDGASLGYGQYADAITKTASGHYEVEDPTARAAIMKLRGDPTASAMMAGALARNNAFQMTGVIGRRPSEGELYAAHFLGPAGAGKLVNAVESRPDANAAKMFPSAAGANRSIFYDRSGAARSVSDVYARLTGRFDNNSVAVAALPATAEPGAAAPSRVSPSQVVADAANATLDFFSTQSLTAGVPAASNASAVPDTAGVTQVLADAHGRLPPVPDNKPLFQAMFSDRAGEAVAPTVANLWTPGAAASGAGSGKDATDRQNSGGDQASRVSANVLASAYKPTGLLDLFTDSTADVRGLFTGRG